MAKDFATLSDRNRSPNPSVHALGADAARRTVLRGGFGAGVAALFAPWLGGCAQPGAPRRSTLGFVPVPPSRADAVVVPPGYRAQVLAAWGEPVGLPSHMPPLDPESRHDADAQAAQFGMHHDAVAYVPLEGSRRGLLVMNHEYTDEGLLHPDGVARWDAGKTRKSQAAVGMSVVEVGRGDAGWRLVRPSRHARRITAFTPCALAGPAAGHRLMRTSADPHGRTVLGTLANCAGSLTPWGTFLSGEENFDFYFRGGDAIDAHHRRWGMQREAWVPWVETDTRFDLAREPHEANRFGWIVELDPLDPHRAPVKRTALGRAMHEGAWVAVTRDGRAAVYSGEDARFEYLYKFVSRDRVRPGGAAANAELLDHGTLYVARFDADGRGRWLPLVHGQGPLTTAHGFADQGEVLVKTRQAGDLLGATKMDRPEWIAIDPASGRVYCTLTNNSRRGAPGQPGVDAANPRANNTMGHIVRWREDGDFDATGFAWELFVLAGDPANARPEARGTVRGDAFACPDGLAFDARGVLWVQTDAAAEQLHRGEFARLGHNQMLACDVVTGELRRFLTGPAHCELTGIAWTPDGRTMFVNVQHPGEPAGDRSDPAWPDRHSRWPSGVAGARPRSATLAITRDDGGVIGA